MPSKSITSAGYIMIDSSCLQKEYETNITVLQHNKSSQNSEVYIVYLLHSEDNWVQDKNVFKTVLISYSKVSFYTLHVLEDYTVEHWHYIKASRYYYKLNQLFYVSFFITNKLPCSINSIIYRYCDSFTSFSFPQSIKSHLIIKSIFKKRFEFTCKSL